MDSNQILPHPTFPDPASPLQVDIKEEVHEPLSVAFTEVASVLSDDELPVCDLLTLSPCENPMQSVESEDFPATMTPLTTTTVLTPTATVSDGLLTDDEEVDYYNMDSNLSIGTILSPGLLDSVSSTSSPAPIKSPEVLLLEYGSASSSQYYEYPVDPDPLQTQDTEGEDDEEEEEFKYKCKDCGMTFAKTELYEIHLSGHANNLRCELCRASLKSFKNYEKHRLKCKPFECNICGKIVRFRPNYLKHLKVHERRSNGETPEGEKIKYQCEVCQKEFTSAEYFRIHQKTHEEGVDLTCKICNKTFSAVACLRSHAKVHTGEKKFRCETCGKGFAQSFNLKVHRRSHSGEKPFECGICGRRSNTMASHNSHLKTHKEFKCELCNETFDQKIKYMSHMSQHETGKVLECNVCGKRFGRSSNFYNHQRIHLGIKKFKCYICGQAFVKAATLDSHLMSHCGQGEANE